MFDSLRDTIQNVQDGISASFRGLSTSDAPSSSSRRSRSSVTSQIVNLNAGADLLHKYQADWQELHQISEDNAKKAEHVDLMICSLHQNLDKQWTNVGTMYSALSAIPQLLTNIQDLMVNIGSLRSSFEEVEESLLALEDLAETQQLREEQLDHRFQLAMYKEKKLQEFEKVRSQLVGDHKEKVKRHEEQQASMLAERQAAFGQAFQEEMDAYKKSGHIPKMAEVRSSLDKEPSLEEVDLDNDSSALDEFLQDDDDEPAKLDDLTVEDTPTTED